MKKQDKIVKQNEDEVDVDNDDDYSDGIPKTVKFLRKRPLALLIKKYNLKVTRHRKYPSLVQLSYSQIDSPMNSPIVQECRGMVVDESNNWNVVCYPYKKFFNYQEPNAPAIATLNLEEVRVTEKVDGSLVSLYFYNNSWEVATSGMPDASGFLPGPPKTATTVSLSINDEVVEKPRQTFCDLFWETWRKLEYQLPEEKDRDKCFMFELITPQNVIIVQHSQQDIVLHGCRNLNTLQEEDPAPLAKKYSWKLVHYRSFKPFTNTDLEKLLLEVRNLNPVKSEGFVLIDKNYKRLKIKSPQYVALHHLSSFNNRKLMYPRRRILQLISANEGDEFLSYFPQWRPLYDDQKKKYDTLCKEIEHIVNDHIEGKISHTKIKTLPYYQVVHSVSLNIKKRSDKEESYSTEHLIKAQLHLIEASALEELIEEPSESLVPSDYGKDIRSQNIVFDKKNQELVQLFKNFISKYSNVEKRHDDIDNNSGGSSKGNNNKRNNNNKGGKKSRSNNNNNDKDEESRQDDFKPENIYNSLSNLFSQFSASSESIDDEIVNLMKSCLDIVNDTESEIHSLFTKKQKANIKEITTQVTAIATKRHTVSTSKAQLLSLESEMKKYLTQLTPPKTIIEKRMDTFNYLERLLKSKWPDMDLKLFGSVAAGISTSSSDLDISFSTPKGSNLFNTTTSSSDSDDEIKKSIEIMTQIHSYLSKEGGRISVMPMVDTARTPIFSFNDTLTELKGDFSFDNHLGVIKAEYINKMINVKSEPDNTIDPRPHSLMLLIKHWAKRRDVNDSTRSTLNSFVINLMVINFLQRRKPPVLPTPPIMLDQSNPNSESLMKQTKIPSQNPQNLTLFPLYDMEVFEEFKTKNTESLSSLFLAFFKYYSEFDYDNDCVCVRLGLPIQKVDTLMSHTTTPLLFCVEDPFILPENCARTVVSRHALQIIKAEFERGFQLLSQFSGELAELFKTPKEKKITIYNNYTKTNNSNNNSSNNQENDTEEKNISGGGRSKRSKRNPKTKKPIK
eukprot:TRINITY_DN6311_c0_g1_i2.p1 TRINITY_DN6311_c0_g1~~TRINITY_DN6311_c0_g1_i2.p1  ORF type:complete len:1020 (-),score=210.07 TRINITY_DN6311_c0_g1_i2:2264-5302(-)